MHNKPTPVYPYLMRDRTIDHVDTVWLTVFVFIPTRGGWDCLMAMPGLGPYSAYYHSERPNSSLSGRVPADA